MNQSDFWLGVLTFMMFVAGLVLFIREIRHRSMMRKCWENRP